MKTPFRCRLFTIKGRSSLFISFKKAFWRGIEKPYRVYFYMWERHLYIALRCPEHLPMYRIHPRYLQNAGFYGTSLRAVIPHKYVKVNDLTKFDYIDLYRFKFHSHDKGISHECKFIQSSAKRSNNQ